MTITSQRALAAIVASIAAILTGLGVALLVTATSCELTASPPTAAALDEPPTSAATTDPPTNQDGQDSGVGDLGRSPSPSPTAAETTETTVAQQCSPGVRDGLAPGLLAGAGATVTAIVAAGVLLLLTPGRGQPPTGPVAPIPAPQPIPARSEETDRNTLIRACVYIRDRVTSKALSDRLATSLAEAGVTPVEPLGARFDPAYHEAGGVQPTDDPTLVGRIAAIESPGYVDRDGTPIRPPVVTVYRPVQRPQTGGGNR